MPGPIHVARGEQDQFQRLDDKGARRARVSHLCSQGKRSLTHGLTDHSRTEEEQAGREGNQLANEPTSERGNQPRAQTAPRRAR